MFHPAQTFLRIAIGGVLNGTPAALFWKLRPLAGISKGLLLACLIEIALLFGVFLLQKWNRSAGSWSRTGRPQSWHHLGPWLSRD
jgi:hypothetical protein